MLTSRGGRGRRAAGVCLGAVMTVFGVVGCGAAGEEPARDAAARFVEALGSQDTARACELLAPDTASQLESLRSEDCEQALSSLELPQDPVTEVAVWGDAAQARTAGDVLFLRELQDGWRVVAAGCEPRGEGQPYDCDLEGS